MADEMKMMSYGEWCRGKQHASAAAAVNSKRNLRAFGSKNLFTKKKREKRGQWSDEWDSQPAAYLPAGGALHTLGTRLIIVTMTVKNFRLHRHDPGPCAGGAGGARASG